MSSPPVQAALAAGTGNVAENVTGPLQGPGGGRTDSLPISTPKGSYVIPADIVSALGDGNSTEGMRKLTKMFGQPMSPPRGPGSVDIMAAPGEFIVPPTTAMQIGEGNPDLGHKVLDRFVQKVREQNIQKLRSIPGPVGAQK